LVILFRPFGFLAPNYFKKYRPFQSFDWSANEGYRNVSCAQIIYLSFYFKAKDWTAIYKIMFGAIKPKGLNMIAKMAKATYA
jgi:hypothetical protein